jgi:anti-anti-sigma regulatory factor
MSLHKPSTGSDRIVLRGSISLPDLLPALEEIRRTARQKAGLRFQLDCAEVEDISIQALEELMKLRAEVRALGSELLLTKCDSALTISIQSSIFRSLIEEEPAAKKAAKSSALQGPHSAFQAKWRPGPARKKGQPREPYFLSLNGARYQRFWLN